MKRTTKVLASVLAVALVACISVAGTLAYLTATTENITNVFTVGNIKIDLTETTNGDGTPIPEGEEWTGKIIPGAELSKDPTVTVKGGSEDCYLYVIVDDGLNREVPGAAEMNIGTEWVEVEKAGNLTLYRLSNVVGSTNLDLPFQVFSTVTISGELDNAQVKALENAEVSIAAYAHQAEGVDVETADAAAIAHFSPSASIED